MALSKFERDVKYAFDKELSGLIKKASCKIPFCPATTYKKNLNMGFVDLLGRDLHIFFERKYEYDRSLERLTDRYLVRKFGSLAMTKHRVSEYPGDLLYHDIVRKSKKILQGHEKLLKETADEHRFRCELRLTEKIMFEDRNRLDKRFYINAICAMNSIPNNWEGLISTGWMDQRKFKLIRRPEELKKALIMSGELFSVARCIDVRQKLNQGHEKTQKIIKEACFQRARDQIDVPTQSCEDVYEELIKDWKQIEHLDLEDLLQVRDQIGFSISHNIGINKDTTNWLDGVTNRFYTGVSGVLSSTKELLSSTFTQQNILKGLSVFIVGSILVGLAVKFACQAIAKLFNFVISMVFGFDSEEVAMCTDQSGGETLFLGPLILLTSVFGVSSSVLKVKQISEALRIISYLPRAESGVETILDWIKQTFGAVNRLYQRYICGVELPLVGENHPVNEWLEKFQDIYEKWTKGIFVFDLITYNVIYSLWKEGLVLKRSPAMKADYAIIHTSMLSLDKILQEFKVRRVVAGTMRNPPVTLLLYGDTSAGKSTATMALAAGILHRIKPDLDIKTHWSNSIYARAAEQEYWDGYTNQPICVFDDYSQAVDTAAAPNLEHYEIIRGANAFPYPLHMADLNDKACTNFNSQIIICSSNLAVPKTESLNYAEALYRRFDICIEVTRKPQYKGKELPHFTQGFYEFQRYEIDAPTRRKVMKEKLSWDAIVEMAAKKFEERSEFVSSVDKFIADTCSNDRRPNIWVEDDRGNITGNEFGVNFRETENSIKLQKMRQKLTGNTVITNPFDPFYGEDVVDVAQAFDQMFSFHKKELPTEKRTDKITVSRQFIEETLKRHETMRPFCNEKENKIVHEFMNPLRGQKITHLQNKLKAKDQVASDLYDRLFCEQNSIIHEEGSLRRLKRKFNSWWYGDSTINDAFDQLKQAVASNSQHVLKRRKEFMVDMQERLPFLKLQSSVAKYFGIFIGALLVFYGVKRIFRSEKPSYTEVILNESYGTVNTRVAKTESYNQPNKVTAKTESYGQKQVLSSKTESITLEITDLPRYENLVANETASQLAQITSSIADQACIDQNAAEICGKVLTRNLYKIILEDRGIGHILMLKGRVGLMPCHFLYYMEEKLKLNPNLMLHFKSVFNKRCFHILLKDFMNSCERYASPKIPHEISKDLCHFSLSKHCTFAHPDISGLFADSIDLSFLKNSACCLPTLSCPANGESFAKVKCSVTGQEITVRDIETKTPGFNNERRIRSCWTYRLDSEEGDCGAPLVLRNPQIQPGKLVGIHVAGASGGLGFSTPVYKSDILRILSMHTAEAQITDQICSVRLPKGHMLDKQGFRPMDKLKVQLPSPSSTVIRPSEIYGMLQKPKTKPCLLRQKDDFDPVEYRLGLYGSEGTAVRQDMVDFAVLAVTHHIKTAVISLGEIWEKKIYTFDESVTGIDGSEYLSSVKRKSSPGFPFITSKNFNTKQKFFGEGPDWNLESKKVTLLRSRCDEIITSARKGERLIHPFIDTLKDERKPIEKAHKTRLFSACSLDYLLVCKQYLMGTVSAVTRARNISGISIGTNVYSQDWDTIARVLLGKSDAIVAGDFSGFDSSQLFQLLRAACDVIVNLFKELFNDVTLEDVLILQVLLESLCCSVHICRGNVYQALKCLPSGHFLTAFINSIFVLILFCCAWQLAFEVSCTSAFKFFEECGIVAYGDDHVVSIPRKYLFKFNQISLVSLFEKLNMIYTSEDKDTVLEHESRDISQVTFLKRSFVKDSRVERYIAPLSLDTILESPMWIKKCVDPVEQTVVELENSLKELSLWPEEIWELHIQKFKDCFTKLRRTTKYIHRAVAFENVQQVWERSLFGQENNLVINDQIAATRITSGRIYDYLPGSLEAAPYHPGKLGSADGFKCAQGLKDTLNNNNKNAQSEKDLTTMSDPPGNIASEVNESVEVRQEITTFADDKAVINQQIPMESNVPQHLRNDFHDERNHSVISFLKRPRIVSTVQWQGQAANTQLIAFNVPTGIFNEMHRRKLDGFTSVRADAILRIQVNAQPFQCGRLIAQIIPIPTLMGTDRVNECVRALDRRVAMHNVQLDIAKQSEVTIRIPYVSPFEAFDLISGKYEWARFVLSVYSPLNQVAQSPLQVNVWGYFENIVLGYPTSSQLYTPATDQIKLNTVQDVAKTIEGHGFITQAVGVLDQVIQSGADLVTGFAPSVAPVVKPIAKVADAAFDIWAGAANALSFIPGLAKPEPAFHGITTLSRPTQNFGTGDGVDHGFKLAMHNFNRLDFIRNWAGSDMDELSFDYLKRIPNYIAKFNYSNNSAYDTILWRTNISPTYRSEPVLVTVGRQGDNGQVSIPTPTHLQYICGPFQQWRGSLVYTFKFVKTDYHSGRVEICFIPFSGASETIAQTDRFDQVYKIIVDLREQTEVSFTVDYTSVTPYKFINNSVNPITYLGNWEQTKAWSTGQIVVRAITPLQLGSTVVSGTIECLVEMKAGDDFEVTVPIKQSFLPVKNTQTTLPTMAIDQVYATAGSRDLRTEYIEKKEHIPSITGLENNIPPISADRALACVGESFGNFRTYIKRFGWYVRKQQTSYFAAYNDLNPATLNTGVVQVGSNEEAWLATTGKNIELGMDPLMYISNMYAFYRGGMRYKLATDTRNDNMPLAKAAIVGTYPEVQTIPQVMTANGYEQQGKLIYEFTMPFNSPTILSPVNYVEDAQAEDTISSPTLMIIGFESNRDNIYIARAAADDFDLGYYIGPPLSFNLDDIPIRTVGSDIDDFGLSDEDGRGLRVGFIGYDPVNNFIRELALLNT